MTGMPVITDYKEQYKANFCNYNFITNILLQEAEHFWCPHTNITRTITSTATLRTPVKVGKPNLEVRRSVG